MTMTTIESNQWACRRRTWFRFRWRPGGKLRGFPWWARHRWRGVKAEGGDAGLAGGVHRYLTMTCTRCHIPEEIHITNLAEFIFCADVKLPREVQLQLGLMPPELKTPLWRRLCRSAGRFVGRSKRTVGRFVRLAGLLVMAPVLVPIKLYKDWHLRRMTYLRGLAELKKHGDYVIELDQRVERLEAGEEQIRGSASGLLTEHEERLGRHDAHLKRHDRRIERLEEQPAPRGGTALCGGCKRHPEECGICHRCVECSDRGGIERDPFLGTHRHIDQRGLGEDYATFGRSF